MKLRSSVGRSMAVLLLFVATYALVFTIRTATDRETWPSAEGTVTERTASGRSISVVVSYPGPNGTEVAKIAETGSAHHVGERVKVRYEVTDGRVSDVALDDARQAHVVVIVLASLATLGGVVLNLAAWRGRDQD
ncbi:hypothetical protein SAMN05192558_101214 [Actinokineospora alba]|uniref:DUF3592 domain-containing protein n=1 Tax=Actinokineospora alba TaxID=504798 RepID=A0A1H0F3D2_9PSEU|nr:DUF3592 domain-containing protein [Actinokineospora alba]TDP69324.1 hypothetical protein C8E96_4910 [Actinokineospora alba]SDI19239.1 hypothetical protein SAMN05421871_103656 [Actinokineospora alba]SDN89168.1 hypothetical protein SAMN05192558_101214 [Actinokineospora alba]